MSELNIPRLVDDGLLSSIHHAFAEMIQKFDRDAPPSVSLAAAIVSEQLARGHICFDLKEAANIVFEKPAGDGSITYDNWPDMDQWPASLRECPAVTSRESDDDALDLDCPLVLNQKHQLYLARYWFYQQRLARNLADRIAADDYHVDETRLADDINRLFPDRDSEKGSDQAVAAANAVDRRLSIITGGPGTGKTTSVAKMLALRLLQHDPNIEPLKILLMAPTGKAAQRLSESLGRAAARIDVVPAIQEQLENVETGTIHRLLKWTPLPPEQGGPFRHSSEFPLEVDVVVIDEASMVDLGLMWHLFEALPETCQVIVMGDRDQLASVEAGGVLADLCGNVSDSRSSFLVPTRCRLIEQRTGVKLKQGQSDTNDLDGIVVNLRYSHRFAAASSLAELASAVRRGDADTAIEILLSADEEQMAWVKPNDTQADFLSVLKPALDGYEEYLEVLGSNPQGSIDVLRALNRFRILCAHRRGRWGDANVNRSIVEGLADRGLLRAGPRHYFGQPVIIQQNTPKHKLYNGDVGVVVRADDNSGLAVLFEDAKVLHGYRRIPASILPESKTCFSMTIHKSQGSEFHNVMMILPAHESPILTRELLYTGITRVCDETDRTTSERRSGRLWIIASEHVLRTAIEKKIRRTSGLRDAVESMEFEPHPL